MTQNHHENLATAPHPAIRSTEQLRAENELRKRDFEPRTAGLREAAELLNTRDAAIRQYRNTPRLLCTHLEQVYEMLAGTLDGPSDRVPYNKESREWILEASRTVLVGCLLVIEVLQAEDVRVPVATLSLTRIVDGLNVVVDPEGKDNYEFQGRQNLIEEYLATDGLPKLRQELEKLRMWYVIKSDEAELTEVVGIETNVFLSGTADPGDVKVISATVKIDGKEVPPRVPRWDQGTRILYFGVEKRPFAPQIKKGVISRILSAFEEERWPNRIDNPISASENEKLKEALRTLNREKQLGLRFTKDGDGIEWSENPLPKSP